MRKPHVFGAALLWLMAAAAPGAGAAELVVGDFGGGFDAWEQRSFAGETRYRGVVLDGVAALEAEADGTASALYRRLQVDLRQTPWLHWRWRVAGTFGPTIDERSRRGDDYPARIYVVRRGGLAFWRTRALNYVWASARPADDRWANAYAGQNVQMWALNSGDAETGHWVSHARDLRADWRAAFGEDITSLDGLALMTDADDTGGVARAWYADIRFSASAEPAWEWERVPPR